MHGAGVSSKQEAAYASVEIMSCTPKKAGNLLTCPNKRDAREKTEGDGEGIIAVCFYA